MSENTAPKATRKPSTETLLKREMGNITRQIQDLDKKIEAFEALQAEMADVATTREELKSALDKVKNDLIEELGLN